MRSQLSQITQKPPEFSETEIANFSEIERLRYERSLKIYRDWANVINTAYDEGVLEGKRRLKKAEKERIEAEKNRKRAEKERERLELADKTAGLEYKLQETLREIEELKNRNAIRLMPK